MTLAEFLLARIANDEKAAIRICPGRNPEHGHWRADSLEFHGAHDRETTRHIVRHDPRRVLAECDAKRRIVELAFQHEAIIDGEWGCCHDEAAIREGRCPEIPVDEIQLLRVLATVYADHPDYKPEWRV